MKILKNGRSILFLIIYSIIALVAYGDITIEVDKTKVYSGETIDFKLIFENTEKTKVDIYGFENFNVSNRGQGSNYSNINGKKTHTITQSYRLYPKKPGKYTFVAKSKDGKYESNSIEVEVLADKRKGSNKVFDAYRKIDKTEYYFGEKIVLGEFLTSKRNLSGLNYMNPFEAEGFTLKNLTNDKYKTQNINLDGQNALLVETFKGILEPISSGEKTIPQRVIRLVYEDGNSSGFFMSDTKEEYLSLEPITLNIKPLPVLNRPDSFMGIVGKIDIDTELVNNKVNIGEGVTLRVTLKGNSNLDKVEKLFPNGADGFRIFESIKDTREDIRDNKYYVEKEFELVFIPQNNKIRKLPDLKVDYFDTEQGKYDSVYIQGEKIKVEGTVEEKKIVEQDDEKEIKNIVIDRIDKHNNGQVNKVLVIISVIESIIILALLFVLIRIKIVKKDNKIDKKLFLKKLKKAKDNRELYDLLTEYLYEAHNISIKTEDIDSLVKREVLDKRLGNLVLKVEEDIYTSGEYNAQTAEEIGKIIRSW